MIVLLLRADVYEICQLSPQTRGAGGDLEHVDGVGSAAGLGVVAAARYGRTSAAARDERLPGETTRKCDKIFLGLIIVHRPMCFTLSGSCQTSDGLKLPT